MARTKKSARGKKKPNTKEPATAKATGATIMANASKNEVQSASTPHILGIPPELRNRIYRYALTSNTPINVNDPRVHRSSPALLATCRTIRDEAISIYYTENEFFFEACKLNGVKALPFTKRMQKYHQKKQVVLRTMVCTHHDFYSYGGAENLRKWLKARYNQPALIPAPAQDSPADKRRESRTLIVRMFGVVDAMRNKPWKDVNAVLAVFYSAAEMMEEFRNPLEDHPEVRAEEMAEMDSDDEDYVDFFYHEPEGNDDVFGSALGSRYTWW